MNPSPSGKKKKKKTTLKKKNSSKKNSFERTPHTKKKNTAKKNKPLAKKTCKKKCKNTTLWKKNSASWKTTFCALVEAKAVRAPTSQLPEEREFVVDSGALMHMLSKKNLSSDEKEKVQRPSSGYDRQCRSAKIRRSANIRSRSWFIRDSTIARRHVCISIARKTLRKPLIFRWVCQRTHPRLSKEGKTITCKIDTKRSEINSSDFGSCWNCLVEFESNFSLRE